MIPYKVKAVLFKSDSPSKYAGQTKWLASKATATGRASMWCRHYHDSEAQAHECGESACGA